MPSSRGMVAWGLHRFHAVPTANAASRNRKSRQMTYDMALAKYNREAKEKLAALEARCKEKK